MKQGRAYLLRCWSESRAPGDRPAWRFSVEEIATERRRRGFGSFEALVEFLAEELTNERRADQSPDHAR